MTKPRKRRWKWPQVEWRELLHTVRTTVAAVVSLLVARLFRLPEAYWAAITTMIVMQSTLGAALNISKQRLAGTALGASLGALFATFIGRSVSMYGVGICLCGAICALLRMDRSAFRYAGITLTIVLLIAHPQPAWVIAIHRFIEISLGIATGLLLTAVWPEVPQTAS
ncbi:MAG: FUSC family protein [Terriglobia bacterium]